MPYPFIMISRYFPFPVPREHEETVMRPLFLAYAPDTSSIQPPLRFCLRQAISRNIGIVSLPMQIEEMLSLYLLLKSRAGHSPEDIKLMLFHACMELRKRRNRETLVIQTLIALLIPNDVIAIVLFPPSQDSVFIHLRFPPYQAPSYA